MKRNKMRVISALMGSVLLAITASSQAVHFSPSDKTKEQVSQILAAKQLLIKKKVVTTTTTMTEISEEYAIPEYSRLSDNLDPELKNFLNEIKAENDRDLELTIINDAPLFFGLSQQFDPDDTERIQRFVDHLTIKINGKEIPHNATQKIRVPKGRALTFSLEIKSNKLASMGAIFKNAVASVADSIKALCFKIIDPMRIQVTYKCPIQEHLLSSQEPLSIATLIYKHPQMAQALNLIENPQFTQMLRFVSNYGRWPQWWDVEFHLPELEKTT